VDRKLIRGENRLRPIVGNGARGTGGAEWPDCRKVSGAAAAIVQRPCAAVTAPASVTRQGKRQRLPRHEIQPQRSSTPSAQVLTVASNNPEIPSRDWFGIGSWWPRFAALSSRISHACGVRSCRVRMLHPGGRKGPRAFHWPGVVSERMPRSNEYAEYPFLALPTTTSPTYRMHRYFYPPIPNITISRYSWYSNKAITHKNNYVVELDPKHPTAHLVSRRVTYVRPCLRR
jgi:hypothetical protein